ncbi:MAG: hypothetical protein R3Y66_08405 [Rikenellaceae bacterium]
MFIGGASSSVSSDSDAIIAASISPQKTKALPNPTSKYGSANGSSNAKLCH